MTEKNSPENKARKVIDECADCDVCRFLMDSDCLMFPELYRLYDKEMETGKGKDFIVANRNAYYGVD